MPPKYEHALPHSQPEEQGISSAGILSFLDAAEQRKVELHGFMFLRHGHVVAEGWWSPYAPSLPHTLWSATKSFTSTAVGFAVQEGRLSVEDLVLCYFPDEVTKEIAENMGTLKIKHLLTMSTGHTKDTSRGIPQFKFLNDTMIGSIGDRKDGDWVKGFLEQPIEKPPGTYFLYNNGASHMLSVIVQKVTGQMLIDYLQPRLFEPLGIEHPVWETHQGVNIGNSGLRLKTEDLARLGLLYLQKGVWNGKRILSPSWVEAATSKQIDTTNYPTKELDWVQGYGYQFWRGRHDSYRADGAFGQFSVVLPKQDAVIAVTSGLDTPHPKRVLELIWDHLLPAIKNGKLPQDEQLQALLKRKLESLSIIQPVDKRYKLQYDMKQNEDQVQSVLFDFQDDICEFTWWDDSGENKIRCGLGTWIADGNRLAGEVVVALGRWLDRKTFAIDLCRIYTNFHDTLYCHFEPDGRLHLHYIHHDFIPMEHSLSGTIVKRGYPVFTRT